MTRRDDGDGERRIQKAATAKEEERGRELFTNPLPFLFLTRERNFSRKLRRTVSHKQTFLPSSFLPRTVKNVSGRCRGAKILYKYSFFFSSSIRVFLFSLHLFLLSVGIAPISLLPPFIFPPPPQSFLSSFSTSVVSLALSCLENKNTHTAVR